MQVVPTLSKQTQSEDYQQDEDDEEPTIENMNHKIFANKAWAAYSVVSDNHISVFYVSKLKNQKI